MKCIGRGSTCMQAVFVISTFSLKFGARKTKGVGCIDSYDNKAIRRGSP